MLTKEPRPKLTYADYARTPEGERWELLNGELFISSAAPNMSHQSVQSNLGIRLGNFVNDDRLGWVFFSVTDVVLSDHDTVQPDLVFVSRERRNIITDANIQGSPDLVVEILSPSTASHDWRDKFDLYALHEIREYWLVSPELETIWVFLLVEGVFEEMGIYGENDTLISPTLEGFSLDANEVFSLR